MTTGNAARPMLPDDNGFFDEYASGVLPVAKPRLERTPESLGCYSSVAHVYETARADERTVLTRKFARWMQLYAVRSRSHAQNALVVARGEWLEELDASDAEVG